MAVGTENPTTIGIAHRSLASQIYDELRRRIIDGRLPAGTWLRERELADELSVSRIPLREALPQLEADGFIISHQRRGAVVRQLTVKDAEEFFEVRSSLEVLVAKLAAQRVAAGASTDELTAAIEAADRATEKGDDLEVAEANAAFHQALTALAANTLLANMMKPLQSLQLWFFGLTSERDQNALCVEHHGLYEAVVEGDEALAESLAFAHVQRSRKESMPMLERSFPAGD